MDKSKILVLIVVTIILGTSIVYLNNKSNNPPGDMEITKPEAAGKPGDILVVMDEYLWVDDPGIAFQDSLLQYLEGLNRPEYIFNILRCDKTKFRNQRRRFRNIIEVEINQSKRTNMNYSHDVWANDQLHIKITSTKKENLAAYFRNNFPKIRKLIEENDRKATLSFLGLHHEKAIEAEIKKKHDLSILVPSGFNITKDEGGFLWLERNRMQLKAEQYHDVKQGIYIYYYPYLDSNTFTSTFQISKRDSMLKMHVPGKLEGSYVMTEQLEGYEPYFKAKKVQGEYAMEIRGLWKLSEGFMGGPFISLTRYDEKNKRIVTAEGYVFAPYFNKMRHIREMESIINSMEFIN